MKIIYSEKNSQIMEQLFVPYFLRDNSEMGWDLSSKERSVLQDVLPIMEELHRLFLPYKEKIQRYYLIGYGLSLLHSVFLEMIDKGLAVECVEEVHNYCLNLTEESIREHLSILLNTEREQMEEVTDFWERLDLSTAKPETKWYFSQFYRQPLDSMRKLVQLSKELTPLYQPYLEQGAVERQAFAQTFSLEAFLNKVPILSNFSWSFAEEEEIRLYIISPWIMNFLSYTSDFVGQSLRFFVVSCRIDQILGQKEGVDLEEFANILKVISDVTRYNVLVELTKPHAKSKDIAEALDITGAAVSFHTQKLINAQLLLLNREDKHIKYDVNKALLKEVIAKLETDFDLES